MWVILIIVVGWFLMGRWEILELIKSKSRLYDVDWRLTFSVAWQESKLDPNAVGDNGRSIGVMQILDTTADMIAGRTVSKEELRQPAFNIELGVRYLKYQLDRYEGDKFQAVSAYNAGSYQESSPGTPINLDYVRKVLAVYDAVQAIAPV